jgi:hypothetical protein
VDEGLTTPHCEKPAYCEMLYGQRTWILWNDLYVVQDRDQWQALVNTVMNLQVPKGRKFLD